MNADSLAFILEGCIALWRQRDGTTPRCDACFTGDYPTTLTDCDPGASERTKENETSELPRPRLVAR